MFGIEQHPAGNPNAAPKQFFTQRIGFPVDAPHRHGSAPARRHLHDYVFGFVIRVGSRKRRVDMRTATMNTARVAIDRFYSTHLYVGNVVNKLSRFVLTPTAAIVAWTKHRCQRHGSVDIIRHRCRLAILEDVECLDIRTNGVPHFGIAQPMLSLVPRPGWRAAKSRVHRHDSQNKKSLFELHAAMFFYSLAPKLIHLTPLTSA
jgi:hypothetical protein